MAISESDNRILKTPREIASTCIIDATDVCLMDKVIVKCDQCHSTFEKKFGYVVKCCRNRMGPYVCRTCSNQIIQSDPKVKNKILRTKKERNTYSIVSKRIWENPEYRKRMGKIQKDLANSDVGRKQRSDQAKNAWKNKEYRKKITQAARDTHITPDYTEEVREKLRQATLKNWQNPVIAKKYRTIHRVSSLQKKLYEILDNLNIKYIKEVDEEEFTKVGFYHFDCIIPKQGNMKKNLLIEVQGERYHGRIRQADDKRKYSYIANNLSHKYEILYIWGREFRQQNKIINRIKNKMDIDIDIKDFDFKELALRIIENRNDSKNFLDLYHYLGPKSGGYIIGAFLGNDLIAVCQYNQAVRKEVATRLHMKYCEVLELSRFCIHPCYQKKNLASWFISRTINLIRSNYPKIKKLVAFSDIMMGHQGIVYKSSNWNLDGIVRPDYWYVDSDDYVMHKKTLYNQAINLSMTEREFAEKYDYMKIWGGEKKRYTYGLR